MISPLAHLILALAALAYVVGADSTSPKGTIAEPKPGTHIAPGAKFTFQYEPLADYGVSTFWFHVWLLDPSGSPPNHSNSITSTLSSVFNTGYYYGRYDYPNYPGAHNLFCTEVSMECSSRLTAVPYATNPCPAQLTMPDFSKEQGFAAGELASAINLQLVVIEEWGNGVVCVLSLRHCHAFAHEHR